MHCILIQSCDAALSDELSLQLICLFMELLYYKFSKTLRSPLCQTKSKVDWKCQSRFPCIE